MTQNPESRKMVVVVIVVIWCNSVICNKMANASWILFQKLNKVWL